MYMISMSNTQFKIYCETIYIRKVQSFVGKRNHECKTPRTYKSTSVESWVRYTSLIRHKTIMIHSLSE